MNQFNYALNMLIIILTGRNVQEDKQIVIISIECGTIKKTLASILTDKIVIQTGNE